MTLMSLGKDVNGFSKRFASFSNTVAVWSGKSLTFIMACLVVVVWAFTGPIFHYSDTWQLVINTGTTIITFLMVFLIQNTQNRDGSALQAKLDAIIKGLPTISDDYIAIDHLTEEEIAEIRSKCEERKVESRS